MKISVFGMGYVGAVSAACLSRDGFDVLGVDINPEKIKMLNAGIPPIIEHGLEDLIKKGLQSGKLKVTTDSNEAVLNTQVSLISVGTPSQPSGAPEMDFLYRVCQQIGSALRGKKEKHFIIIRSTVFPGSTKKCQELIQETAGHKNFLVAFNPEFLREGSAIQDYNSPAYTVIGTHDDEMVTTIKAIYQSVEAPVIKTTPETAELIKYTANAWHATKITFANEVGRLANSYNVDAQDVMNMITQDTKLNISSAYLRPGFAFGGSCLPKDVRALNYFSKLTGVEVPLLASLSSSNQNHIEYALNKIIRLERKKIGICGISFKSGTDDLRESPGVELTERLIGKGFQVKIYDPSVFTAKLVGANKRFIDEKVPHLSTLLVKNVEELLLHTELLIITNGDKEFLPVFDQVQKDIPVLDLSCTFKNQAKSCRYFPLV